MPNLHRRIFPPVLALPLLLAAPGCSGPGEDVRVALCKDMASLLAGTGDAPWRSTVEENGRFKDLVVTVRPESGAETRATCRYPFDAEAEEFNLSANPLAVYDTYPSAMSLNGEPLSGKRLAELVQQALLQQGRELADETRQRIEQAGAALGDALSGNN